VTDHLSPAPGRTSRRALAFVLWCALLQQAVKPELERLLGPMQATSPSAFLSAPDSVRQYSIREDARPGPLPNVFRLPYPPAWLNGEGEPSRPLAAFVDGRRAAWLAEEPAFDRLNADRAYAYIRDTKGQSIFVVCPQEAGCSRLDFIRDTLGARIALRRSRGELGMWEAVVTSLKVVALSLVAWTAFMRLGSGLLVSLVIAEALMVAGVSVIPWWTGLSGSLALAALALGFQEARTRIGRESLTRFASPLGGLILAPAIVLGSLLLAGYTLSHNSLGSDRGVPYRNIGVTPIADPAGSSLLGEPYLVHLERNLERGRIPLLNMQNGLGAMGVESLLNGSFYVLNPLLLLLPMDKPLYFDLFTLLHVYILLLGFYYFLRHYASEFAAAGAAILVGLSGVTFMWANMEHYRSFAWLPVMLGAAVSIAREQRIRKSVALLAFATIACCTAGNIQEFGADVAATCVIYTVELLSGSPRRPRSVIVFGGTLLSSLMISSIAFMPYFASVRDGNVWATNEPARSVRHVDPVWIFNWILPKVEGVHPFLFLRDALYWPHSDLSTAAFLLLVLGVIYGLRNRGRMLTAPDVAVCLLLPIVIVMGLVKVVHVPLLDFVRNIPFAQQFFFAKYYLYLFALASAPIAIGLDWISRLEGKDRRPEVRRGAMIVALLLVLIAIHLWLKKDYLLQPGIPRIVVLHVLVGDFGVALVAFLATAAVLYWQPRHWRPLALGIFITQSWLLLPVGFGKRAAEYPVRYQDEATPGNRLLIREVAASNLFFNVESIAFYDAIVNAHYREFINTFFSAINPFAIYQPTETVLTAAQVRALQLVGTSAVYGYESGAPELVRSKPNGFDILDPLPRAFVVSQATYRSLRETKLSKDNVESVVAALLKDVRSLPQPVDIEVIGERVAFSAPAGSEGAVLVLNQGYSSNWTYRGQRGEPMMALWPSWPLQAGERQEAVYWPRGLTVGLRLAPLGFLLLLATWRFAAKRRPGDPVGAATNP
jgi:hypothetical protein